MLNDQSNNKPVLNFTEHIIQCVLMIESYMHQGYYHYGSRIKSSVHVLLQLQFDRPKGSVIQSTNQNNLQITSTHHRWSILERICFLYRKLIWQIGLNLEFNKIIRLIIRGLGFSQSQLQLLWRLVSPTSTITVTSPLLANWLDGLGCCAMSSHVGKREPRGRSPDSAAVSLLLQQN